MQLTYLPDGVTEEGERRGVPICPHVLPLKMGHWWKDWVLN